MLKTLKFFFIITSLSYKFSYAFEVCGNFNAIYQHGLDNTNTAKLLCPVELEADIKKIEKHSKLHYQLGYCLFDETAVQHQGGLCKSAPRPLFIKKTDEKNKILSCGFRKNQFIYAFGFYYCGGINQLNGLRNVKNSKIINKEVYQNYSPRLMLHYTVCYNVSTNKTIWTNHRILATRQVFNKNVQFAEESTCQNNIRTDSFFMRHNPFLKMNQRYTAEKKKSDYKMVPQPMVPVRHFATCGGKKTAKHYINMAPLWDQFIPLINLIDDGIKEVTLRVLERQKQVLRIYTAIEDVEDSEFFSNLKRKLHFDKTFKQNIWYKFVYNEYTKAGVIIYIHNTPRKEVKKMCNDKKCNFKAWASSNALIDTYTRYAYCCETTAKDVKKIFQLNLDVRGFLDMNSLFTGSNLAFRRS